MLTQAQIPTTTTHNHQDTTEIYKRLQSEIRRIELEINTNETKLSEMEKQIETLPQELQALAQSVKQATTQEELNIISLDLDRQLAEMQIEYKNILESIGLN